MPHHLSILDQVQVYRNGVTRVSSSTLLIPFFPGAILYNRDEPVWPQTALTTAPCMQLTNGIGQGNGD